MPDDMWGRFLAPAGSSGRVAQLRQRSGSAAVGFADVGRGQRSGGGDERAGLAVVPMVRVGWGRPGYWHRPGPSALSSRSSAASRSGRATSDFDVPESTPRTRKVKRVIDFKDAPVTVVEKRRLIRRSSEDTVPRTGCRVRRPFEVGDSPARESVRDLAGPAVEGVSLASSYRRRLESCTPSSFFQAFICYQRLAMVVGDAFFFRQTRKCA